jgi:hypothetical protein
MISEINIDGQQSYQQQQNEPLHEVINKHTKERKNNDPVWWKYTTSSGTGKI